MSNSLKEAFVNLESSIAHCQENSRSLGDVLKRGCADLADNADGLGLSVYSTDEVVIGKWIDGTSDVCRKVFTNLNTTLNGDNWVVLDGVTIPGVNILLDVTCFRVTEEKYAQSPILESMPYTSDSVRVASLSGVRQTVVLAVITYVKSSS